MCRLPPIPCGSEPAREDGGSACIHFECATAIASKLGSHRSGGVPGCAGCPQSPVGASLLAKTVGQLASILNVLLLSRASSAPTGPVVYPDVPVAPNPLWEPSLLAKSVGQLASILNVLPPSRASSAPTGPMVCLDVPVVPQSPVGAGLLAKTVGSACIHFECATAIASKLSSHRSGGVPGCAGCPQPPVGASLLAKTVDQRASILNVLPPSRASSALTGPVVYPDVPVAPNPLWERACSRWRSIRHPPCGAGPTPPRPAAESARPSTARGPEGRPGRPRGY